MNNHTAFIGFTTKRCDGFDNFLPAVKAPINYKDEVAIAKYIEVARQRQYAEADSSLLTGVLDQFCVINDVGEQIAINPEKESLLQVISCFKVTCGFRVYDMLDFAVKDMIQKTGNLPGYGQWAKIGRVTRHSYLDPSANGRRVIFDPIEALGGPDAVQDPLLLAKNYGWNINKLETAEDFARLSFMAGRCFSTKELKG